MGIPQAFTVDTSGDILVSDITTIMRVDPDTGFRSLINNGIFFVTNKGGRAVNHDGQLFLSDSQIYGVNLATNVSRIVSSVSVGSGPQLSMPTDVAVLHSGNLIVPDNRWVLVIDPVTGFRSLLSSSNALSLRGAGPGIFPGNVLVVPEPASIVLLAWAALYLGLEIRRRRPTA